MIRTVHTSQIQPAVGAAVSTASALDLRVDDAVVLHDSNRLALRLRPCDVLARVAHMEGRRGAEFEVEVARRLAETDSPVASLDPRVEPRAYLRDGFVITLWTYYEPVSHPGVRAAEYAQALEQLHAGMRQVDFITPHFSDRVAEAQSLVGNRAQTPDLRDADRELLSNTLRTLTWAIGQRDAAEQLLHGEPHPGNLLKTEYGLLYTDLETCCRGPVEFDVAHVPEQVSTHYPDADQDLLWECRILMLAMVATWRWDRDDQFPNGHRMGTKLLSQIRAAPERDNWAIP
jgi:Phosphotransferase enzyme family